METSDSSSMKETFLFLDLEIRVNEDEGEEGREGGKREEEETLSLSKRILLKSSSKP